MKILSPKLMVILLSEMALALSLGCAERSTTLSKGGNSTQGAVVAGDKCEADLAVTLTPNIPAIGVRIGDTINFEISASGCTGSYVAETSNGTVIPLVNDKAFFPVTYNAVASNVFERVQVRSVDTKGNVLRLVFATKIGRAHV